MGSRSQWTGTCSTWPSLVGGTWWKNRITLVSVAAALVLTTLKLVVGLLTGSLGLLSEAAHSGLDLVASILTFFSVRIAGRPADADHPHSILDPL